MDKLISENKLRKIIREAIKKTNLVEAIEPSVFESECMITVVIDENITNILTKMRAIESVTIVSIEPGGGRTVGRNIERLKLKIKFVKGGFSVRQRLSTIVSKIVKIEGVVGFKIQSTRKLEKIY
tara:strand:+ start:185 stop:559 length:375 start_codon:yes stop_codon:yes gene_type:complete